MNCLLSLFATLLLAVPSSQVALPDPLFDLSSIQNEPVDGKVLSSEVKEGIVLEVIEFTSRVVDGRPERVQGILAYPEGGRQLPAIFWSMGGMAPANAGFPSIFARKGYACLAITLPHPLRKSQERFDTENPKEANLTLLALDQLRAITYLSQRPEIDPERLGVGGASYGGMFATLLAGIDPRLKAGASFFGGGNHDLGTNLPQFTKMQTKEEVAIWNKTIDPALRHRTREVPFLWAVAFNDNWFFFPALAKTYAEAISPEKRLVIMPYWQHGFPEAVDQQIVDFFDTTLTKTRPSYLQPSPLKLRISPKGDASVGCDWKGTPRAVKAELVVSYGEVTPWLGWLHRACFVFPAHLEEISALAQLPVPSKTLPMIVWMNVTDENGVITSTPPLTLTGKELADVRTDPHLVLNTLPDGALGPVAFDFYRRANQSLPGVPDLEETQTGTQSLRVDALGDGKPSPPVILPLLHHVPGLAHTLRVRVKASEPTSFTVKLTPARPKQWSSAAVAKLVADDVRLKPLLEKWEHPPKSLQASETVNLQWREITVNIPQPTEPVEGYHLEIHPETPLQRYWVDAIEMQPIWPHLKSEDHE